MQVSSLVALALAGLVFIAYPAHADAETAAATSMTRTSDVKSSSDEGDKMVCDYEKRVGTHMKSRVCKTLAERRRQEEKAKELMDARVICSSGCNR